MGTATVVTADVRKSPVHMAEVTRMLRFISVSHAHTVGGAKPSRYLRERISWFALSWLVKWKFAASQRSSSPGKRVALTASNAGSVMRQPMVSGVHSGFLAPRQLSAQSFQ